MSRNKILKVDLMYILYRLLNYNPFETLSQELGCVQPLQGRQSVGIRCGVFRYSVPEKNTCCEKTSSMD
jgi:hypothetical protein